MRREIQLKAVVDPHHKAKVLELSKATGLGVSGVLRALIENATLEQRLVIQSSATVLKNAKDGASTFQSESTVFA